MKVLSLRADFHGLPLAIVHGPGSTEYILAATLPISDSLKEKIKNWDEKFQSTLAAYPPDSKFSNIEEEESHYQEGLSIAKELSQYFVGQFKIQYYVNGRGKIYVEPLSE